MAVLGELLFYDRGGRDLSAYLTSRSDNVRAEVEKIDASNFATRSDADLAAAISAATALKPLQVAFDAATSNVEEATFEEPNQWERHRTVRVQGLRATKKIPFRGDRALWHLRPNPFDMNPPRGIVASKEITIGMEIRDSRSAEALDFIDSTINSIRVYLERQEKQISQHNAGLAKIALPLIESRRKRLGAASDLLNKLKG